MKEERERRGIKKRSQERGTVTLPERNQTKTKVAKPTTDLCLHPTQQRKGSKKGETKYKYGEKQEVYFKVLNYFSHFFNILK